ncbi:hypothetical protein ACP275_12G097400 [Erythranthe tilingii]
MDFFSNIAKSAAQSKPSSDQPADDSQEKSSNYDLFGSAKVVAAAAQSQFGNEPEKYDKVKVAGASADLLGAASDYGKFDETQGFGKYANQAEGYLRQYGTPQTTIATTPMADTAGLEKTAAATDDAPAAGEKIAAAVDDKIVLTKTTEADDKIIPIKTADADEYPTGGAEDGGTGDYIKKAAGNYLSKPTDDAAESGGDGDYIKKGGGDYLSKPSDVAAEDGGDADYIKKADEYLNKPSEEEAESGGADDYIKKAGGFLNKPSGDGGEKTDEASSEPGGGYGGLMKTAGGFFNMN